MNDEIDAKLEELHEELERLKDIQNKILGYSGDDLWVRDDIAKTEDLIRKYEWLKKWGD